jgi:DNA polymerase-3 subunit delta
MGKLGYEGGVNKEHAASGRGVTPKTEARVYDLGKMILAGNPQRAMEILHDLFYLREAPIAVLAALITGYVDLYRARAAKDTGVSAPEVVSRFGYKGREFRVNNAFGARISLPALRRSLQLLAECDRAMKSSGADDQVLLERTVVALIGARGL